MNARLLRRLAPAALTLLTALPAFAQPKIALLDHRKVFDNYYKTKAANVKLEERRLEMDKELKALGSQYEKAADEYKKALDEANNQAVAAEEREKRKKAAEAKLRDLQDLEQSATQYRTQARTRLQEQQRRMTENLWSEIRAAVHVKAKAAGYSLVLDTSGESIQGVPVILYNNGENDLTESVLAQLNASAPPEAAKSSDKK